MHDYPSAHQHRVTFKKCSNHPLLWYQKGRFLNLRPIALICARLRQFAPEVAAWIWHQILNFQQVGPQNLIFVRLTWCFQWHPLGDHSFSIWGHCWHTWVVFPTSIVQNPGLFSESPRSPCNSFLGWEPPPQKKAIKWACIRLCMFDIDSARNSK